MKQAEDNYRTAETSSIVGAKPVLLYYSFLNLAKAYVLTRGRQTDLDRAKHGVSDWLAPGGVELLDSSIHAEPTVTGQKRIQVFHEFFATIDGVGLQAATNFPLAHLLGQVVTGHRLWTMASKQRERFLPIDTISIRHDPAHRAAWLTVDIAREDVARLGLATPGVLVETRLDGAWTEVDSGSSSLLRLEQTAQLAYQVEPGEVLGALVRTLSPHLWTTVLSVPPYRKYYLYALTAREEILPQVMSMYAVLFYLGSLTRYRPHRFLDVLSGVYGSQIQEVIATVPSQLLYLMTSNFAEHDLARAAII